MPKDAMVVGVVVAIATSKGGVNTDDARSLAARPHRAAHET
jgi:hypothetical protein